MILEEYDLIPHGWEDAFRLTGDMSTGHPIHRSLIPATDVVSHSYYRVGKYLAYNYANSNYKVSFFNEIVLDKSTSSSMSDSRVGCKC